MIIIQQSCLNEQNKMNHLLTSISLYRKVGFLKDIFQKQLRFRSRKAHSEDILPFILILAAEVIEHLRDEQDLNDLLDDNANEIASKPKIEGETVVAVPGVP